MQKQLNPVSYTVDMATIRAYADLTDDHNPIHIDREFAEKTEMKGVIAHGTMSLSLIWQALARTLGNDGIKGAKVNVRFVRPVREDDVVTGGGEEIMDTPGKFDVWVKNQNGEFVIKGTAQVAE